MILFGLQCIHADQDEAQEIDEKGIAVELVVPWTTIIVGERIQYQFILTNASNKVTPVAVPNDSFPEPHYGWPTGGQLFLSPIWETGYPGYDNVPLPNGRLRVEMAEWPPIDGFGDLMRAWLDLPDGKSITWSQNRISSVSFGIISNRFLVGLQGHWLFGPDKWISSDVVRLQVLDIPMSEWNRVFTTQWNDGSMVRTDHAYTISIDGKKYLFYDRHRLLEVDENDRFDYRIDEDDINLVISIISQDYTKELFYHLRQGIINESPWPDGPIEEVFFPQPEPIPPADLAKKRAEMGLNPDGGHPDRGANSGNDTHANESKVDSFNVQEQFSPESSSALGGFWLWVSASSILVLVSAWMLLRTQKSTRSK